MLFQSGNCSGSHVTGGTHFERYVPRAQGLKQDRIVDRMDTMADPLRADLECVPDTLRTRNLPGMAGQGQPRFCRFPVKLLKPGGGASLLVASNSNGDYAFLFQIACNLKYALGRCCSKLANCVENPGNPYARKPPRNL